MKSIIVNLFGGPGSGKSTHAAGLFYALKRAGINAELVTEYARELSWQGALAGVTQKQITKEQLRRQSIADGQAEVVITDSPIILGLVYSVTKAEEAWKHDTIARFKEQKNLNAYLYRQKKHGYRRAGRAHTEQEALAVDEDIRSLLVENEIPYLSLSGNGDECVSSLFLSVKTVLEWERPAHGWDAEALESAASGNDVPE